MCLHFWLAYTEVRWESRCAFEVSIKWANYIYLHWWWSSDRDVFKCLSACYISRLVCGLHKIQWSASIIVFQGERRWRWTESSRECTHKSVCDCPGPVLATRISKHMPESQMTKKRRLYPVSSLWNKHMLQHKSSKSQCENNTFQPQKSSKTQLHSVYLCWCFYSTASTSSLEAFL